MRKKYTMTNSQNILLQNALTEKIKSKCAYSILRCVQIAAIYLLSLSFDTLNAQTPEFSWAVNMGGANIDHAYEVATDAEGNVYIAGHYASLGIIFYNSTGANAATLPTSRGSNDVFIAKYDARGNYKWSTSFGGNSVTGSEQAWGIAVDNKGNVYVTGPYGSKEVYFTHSKGVDTIRSAATGVQVPYLVKYDTDGNYLWGKSIMSGIGAGKGEGVATDANGNVYVAGQYTSSGGSTVNFNPDNSNDATANLTGPSSNMFLASYDGNGKFRWVKDMGGTTLARAYSVATDAKGAVLVAGQFYQKGYFVHSSGSGADSLRAVGTIDGFVAKFDEKGGFQWAKVMGGGSQVYANGVTTDSKLNVYVTGYFPAPVLYFPRSGSTGRDSLRFTGTGGNDVFLVKYDPNGNYQWSGGIGGTGADQGRRVVADGDDNVYITGYFTTTAYVKNNTGANIDTLRARLGNDAFVASYDNEGHYRWTKTIGGTGADQGWGVAVDANRNVYAAGYFTTTAFFNFKNSPVEDTLRAVGNADGYLVKLSQGCQVYHTVKAAACNSYTFNGVTYTQTGTYVVDTFTSWADCDSIVTLNLTIAHPSNNPVVSGRYCDSVTINGTTYSATGTYTQAHTNAGGCDSSITYDITIDRSNGSTETHIACGSFAFDDSVYTATGVYSITFTNASGCDSVVVLDLTINDFPEASVTQNDTTLTANDAESYQWINCEDNSFIPGATDKDYTVTETGSYAVILTENGCSDTSDCISVEIEVVDTGDNNIRELGKGNAIQLYPNPTDSRVTIQAARELKNATIRLVNILGQSLAEQVNQHGMLFALDISRYASGVYFVEISEGGNVVRLKVVKE